MYLHVKLAIYVVTVLTFNLHSVTLHTQLYNIAAEVKNLKSDLAEQRGEATSEETAQAKEAADQELRDGLQKIGNVLKRSDLCQPELAELSAHQWGEYGHLGASSGAKGAEYGVLGAAAGQAQAFRGQEASAQGIRGACKDSGWGQQSVEQARLNGMLGKEFGIQGAKYGRMGGRPPKAQDPSEPDIPDSVLRGLGLAERVVSPKIGEKRKACQFIVKKLSDAGYDEKDGSQPTPEQWHQVRLQFGKGIKTRAIQRCWQQRTRLEEGVEALRLGSSGGMYARRRSKQGIGGQLGKGYRLIDRHIGQPDAAKKGPGKRSALLPVFRKVNAQFQLWRKGGMYVDMDDLFVEYAKQALNPQETHVTSLLT